MTETLPASSSVTTTGDLFGHRLAEYTVALSPQQLGTEALHAATVRVVDTFGALLAGLRGEPCEMARGLARELGGRGATLLGTAEVTTPDMAAFVNGLTARYAELNDVYHWPGSGGGHPSDVIMPLFAVAEARHSSGSDFLTAVTLAYEIFLRVSDATQHPAFDHTNLTAIGVAAGAAKLMGLAPLQVEHSLALAAVSATALAAGREGHLSMWKAAGAGLAGRLGVFSCQLAAAGMTGPERAFAGPHGWLSIVAQAEIDLSTLSGNGTFGFKILETLLKPRASCATTIPSIFAAEDLYKSLAGRHDIRALRVRTYGLAKSRHGTGDHHWHPSSRETADHSIPYVVAAALLDGTVGRAQFDAAHLADPRLRDLMAKVTVEEDPTFTAAYERIPLSHPTTIEATLETGDLLIGRAGRPDGRDLSDQPSDEEETEKFPSLATDVLSETRARFACETLWALEEFDDVSLIAHLLAI